MNDGAVTPTPIVQTLGLGQLNCRRLWGRDGSVHDGFMGLVSCLDQLGVQVLCVQETQSHLMSSLPVDGMMALLAVMVARRVSFSALPLWRPLSLGPPGASSRALFVSAHSIRHMLALPLTHAPSSGAPSRLAAPHRHPASSCGGLCIWFTFFQLFRSRQADAPLLPIEKEILQSHSLVFRNPPDLPTHRCGATHIILSSPSLPACVRFHLLSTCASLLPPALFRPYVVLLSS